MNMTKKEVMKTLDLANDADLASLLDISPQAVSKCGDCLPEARMWQLAAWFPRLFPLPKPKPRHRRR